MSPEETLQRRVGIPLFVRKSVVPPMHGNPESRRELQTAGSEDGEAVLEPQRAGKAAMGYEPVEAEIDTENAEHIHSDP